MKKMIMIVLCMMLYTMPVYATQASSEEQLLPEEVSSEEQLPSEEEVSSEEQLSSEEEVSSEEQLSSETEFSSEISSESKTENAQGVMVEIPDVRGKTEEEALQILESMEIPEGYHVEMIKEYAYSEEAETDIVYKQEPLGSVSIQDQEKIYLTISMGKEPVEGANLKLNKFGIGGPINQSVPSRYGIDWDALPHSFEYNWDNSSNCWYHGVWIDGVKYTTPVGTYDTNVRHKMQLHCDGTNIYLHIVFSRDYMSSASAHLYEFFLDGERTAFRLDSYNGKLLTNTDLNPGTYGVTVRHADSSDSFKIAEGASAYFTVFDSRVNAELEMKIPISEMVRQNPNINPDQIGSISFFSPNLTYRKVTISGASTFPFVFAAVTFILVLGSFYLIKRKKDKEKHDKEKI